MHIIKPSWLTHGGELKDFEVYSCDVSPDGKRLVTAAGDGYVRIWSTEAIYHADDPAYADKPRQLASLSNHSGTIHAVRFSPNGKYVASGADDRIVCVYGLDEGAAPSHSTFGTDEPPPVENWRTILRLIGHDNDVQDLGWSYDSSILVTVGLDSKVVVWSGHTFEKLKVILNHHSLVKGITFDPANRYFATASDDRTVRVFRFTSPTPNTTAHDCINNFVLEQTITQPFTHSPLTTYFRRCSWTPDGAYIVAANAVNGPVTCAALIHRGDWESDITFIGHEAPVEVCKCSQRLYSWTSPPKYDKGNIVHTPVVATASGDRALSIWIGSNARPLVVMQDLANKAFTDLAWSPDGLCLFATALDGSILVLRFEEKDIGYVLPLEENERCLAKFKSSKKGVGVAESANVLLLEEKSKAGEQRNVEGRMGALMGDHHFELGGIQSTSINTGPIAMGSAPTAPREVGNGSAQETPRPTSAGGDKNKENDKPADGPSNEEEKPEESRAEKIERLKQKPTYTKEGKKRIQPMLISASSGAASTLSQSRLITQSSATTAQGKYEPEAPLDLSKPFDRLPKGGLPALLFGNKRRYAGADEDDKRIERKVRRAAANGAVPILRHDSEGHVRPAETASTDTPRQEPVPEFIRPAVVNPNTSVSTLRLAVPRIRTVVSLGVDNAGSPTDPTGKTPSAPRADLVLEIKNPPPTQTAQDATRVFLVKGDQVLWQDFVERPVLLATGNKKLWAAACDDGTIYIWTPAGRRLLNALQLEAAPVILECMDSWVLAISAVGTCYVWNTKTLSSPHPPVSLAPILDAALRFIKPEGSRAPCVNGARINSEGRIVVVLSNGDAYSYSPMLYTWQRMSETWWACTSQYWNTTDSSVGNIRSSRSTVGHGAADLNDEQERRRRILSAGIIPYMERNTTTELLKHGRGSTLQNLLRLLVSGQREDYELFERLSSVAHLENRVAAALSLGAKEEFRIYLSMYAKRLGAEGFKERAEELMENILGGIFEEEEDAKRAEARRRIGKLPEGRMWMEGSETLCGWDRKELLTEVILALGKHRDFQRVTLPYAHLLGILDDDGPSRDGDITMVA
ncbi:MAP kinase kinase (MEK) [Ascosphaera pollenicola]|nr:MAP kinase kinase (MEK) [Ascosphaera pollenicola]